MAEMQTPTAAKQRVPAAFPVAFLGSALMVIALLTAATISPEGFIKATDVANRWISHLFGPVYLWFAIITLLMMVGIAVSPLGNIRLGGADARPEHGFLSWFAMLFCAGMGTGFMFWGAAEPLVHYTHPPLVGVESHAARQTLSLAYTFFHWGLSPWAIYGMTSIATGFLCFNCRQSFRFSDFLLGSPGDAEQPRKKDTLWHTLIDFFTLTAIVFGLAATFGMGVLLVEGGLSFVFGFPPSWILKSIVALGIIGLFWLSSARGLDKGIKVLSNISMLMCLGLFIFVAIFGSSVNLFAELGNSIGMYINKLPAMSIGAGEFAEPGWVGEWTIMYWTWWIAWAPFVGVFIALISKGRTLRSITTGVLIVPTLVSCLWFSVMGMAAISLQGTRQIAGDHFVVTKAAQVLFQMLGQMPWPEVTSIVSLLIVMIFVSNSADSAIYTLATLTTKKDKPSLKLQAGWAVLFCTLAMTLVLSGGIVVLRKVTAIAVMPFTVLLSAIFILVLVRMLQSCGILPEETPQADEESESIQALPNIME